MTYFTQTKNKQIIPYKQNIQDTSTYNNQSKIFFIDFVLFVPCGPMCFISFGQNKIKMVFQIQIINIYHRVYFVCVYMPNLVCFDRPFENKFDFGFCVGKFFQLHWVFVIHHCNGYWTRRAMITYVTQRCDSRNCRKPLNSTICH